jgi:hypothetical protein
MLRPYQEESSHHHQHGCKSREQEESKGLDSFLFVHRLSNQFLPYRSPCTTDYGLGLFQNERRFFTYLLRWFATSCSGQVTSETVLPFCILTLVTSHELFTLKADSHRSLGHKETQCLIRRDEIF